MMADIEMDGDNQSEDGEIKKSPSKDMEDYSFSEEEGGDTADSLDIKPPQAMVRHHKTITTRRRDKHVERRDRREEKERKSRHHEREERHRDKHRHRRHGVEGMERVERPEGSKRERDRIERIEAHGRERESSRHERKERTTGDRVLEDLRERLLDKRRERREDPREYKGESRRELRVEETREVRETRDRREMRMEEVRERREIRTLVDDTRDRREVRVEERRHVRVMEEQYVDPELIERPEREKRHKRSHKHERTRDRDREKVDREREHREKQLREAMDVVNVEDPEEEEVSEVPIESKEVKELSEQELRKERLLEADREMARRKEVSRLELEARRMKRGEKRPKSPDPDPDPSVVELSDESPSPVQSEGVHSNSRHSSEEQQSNRERSSDRQSSESSETTSDEEDESNESNKGSNEDSNDGSDYNNPSPLSVDRLAKSDHSDGDSPGHVDSNGAAPKEPPAEEKKPVVEEEEEPELPPYLPAIQGCRSVEEFQCLNRIDEGTFGVVYRARDKRTDEIVALKRLKMEKEKDGFPITSLREINTLLKAQHPNIVTVREIVVGSNMDKIFIVMEYVEHDLKSLMETMKQKKQVFIPGEVKCLMQQLLRAVSHLHDNWILHRDLKTSNLLLNHRGILKVGDFGLAREYGSPLRQYTSIVVTLWYRAPELLLRGRDYSTPIDMWSVGCIFAELLRMQALFPGDSEIDQLNRIFKELGTPSDRIWPGYSQLPMVQKVGFTHYPVNNLRQRFSLSLSDLGIELLNKFLTYDPHQRITAEDALKHGYFTETPLPIDPEMFPTWPAKSELGIRTANASPKPPSGGKEYKQLGDADDAELRFSGFHMGVTGGGRQPPMGGGFHLRF
ncbi:cyclin-dependent kinase 11B isoform X2 [Orussus abietinus]|uniref:cyclin-dependent kinase 11B isoform X2 n=1 Tax=Orussus abietinus TaxID=222816 RepID=UPI000625E927|nr:cyclin-dependent kinase 11B isoform X2 [Orussus abietinus]